MRTPDQDPDPLLERGVVELAGTCMVILAALGMVSLILSWLP